MAENGCKIQGFSRVQLTENGEVIGDSGFIGPNQITNIGFLNYLCHLIGASSGSRQVGFIALGTGGVTASNASALEGEIMGGTQRKVPTYENIGNTTAQFTATFASDDSFLTESANLSNIGLFNGSAENSIFAGNTYSSSACATNQNVNVTYQIRFS